MRIEPFGVEMWMNAYENHCRYNLAETCVESLTVAQLLDLAGVGPAALDEVLDMKLTYGPILGSDRLRRAIAALYETRSADDVLVTHGAIGANKLVHETVVEPGQRVIAVQPTYQQHYSIPASYGADVRILDLRADHGFLPDIDELRDLASPETSLIAINNPNNPTGALMDSSLLQAIADVAGSCDAWVLCDEVYRGTDQHGGGTTVSMADLYPKGISTGSMSKAFSLAGLRLGWITGPQQLLDRVAHHRDYSTISVGMINDHLSAIALENADRLLERSRAITRTNLAILDQWVQDEPLISWVKPSAGTTALLSYDLDVPSRTFCVDLLESTGVLFTPGSALAVEGTVRIGYANNERVLRQGLAEVSRYLHAPQRPA